jgi:hypothetical protein
MEVVGQMSVQEIESAVTQLSTKELTELLAWLGKYHESIWDMKIEEDLEAGRLDTVLAEVDQEPEAGLALTCDSSFRGACETLPR